MLSKIVRTENTPYIKANTVIHDHVNLVLDTGITTPNAILIEQDLINRGQGKLFISLPYKFIARRDLSLAEYIEVLEYCKDCNVKIPDCALYGGQLNKVDPFNISKKKSRMLELASVKCKVKDMIVGLDIESYKNRWSGYYAAPFRAPSAASPLDSIMWYFLTCISAGEIDSEGLYTIFRFNPHTTLGCSIQESCVKGVLSFFQKELDF